MFACLRPNDLSLMVVSWIAVAGPAARPPRLLDRVPSANPVASIWVLAFGLPLWLDEQLDANTRETLNVCLMGIVLVLLAMPWGYVFRHYMKASGDRWCSSTLAPTKRFQPPRLRRAVEPRC